MSLLEELATLPVFDEADGVDVSDETYQDSTPPAPIAEGKYRIKIDKIGLDKDKDGKLQLTDGKYPVLVIESATVVEPADRADARAVGYERVYSKPFDRNGVKASGLGDLSRSLDTARTWRIVYDPSGQQPNGIGTVLELVDGGATAKVKIIWEAYDKDHYEATLAANGGDSATPAKKKELRKAATIKGMAKFPVNPDGSRSHVIVGPSGAHIEARARIANWYPSSQDVKFG